MRTRLYLLIAGCALIACSKPGTDDNENPPQPPPVDPYLIPAKSPVTTSISAFVEINIEATNPVALELSTTRAQNVSGGYSFNSINGDRFVNHIDLINRLTATQFFDNSRNIPLTNSSRNYVDLNNMREEPLGSLTYSSDGGAWPLPLGGQVTYTPYSFGNYSGGAVGAGGRYAILDPSARAFAITNPSFVADADQKRWFLDSYGIFNFKTQYPIAAVSDVKIEFPIPETLRANAPDSIEAWYYTGRHWIPKGYAKKLGNHYVKKLDVVGMWNFAVRSKGLYKTIKVRTDKGVPVTNTILRFKRGNREVGGTRTDADGNAVCFLPVDGTLSIDILQRWSEPGIPLAFSFPAKLYEQDKDIDMVLPASSPWVTTIKGTATLCNGGAVEKGTVIVTTASGLVNYYIPVNKGEYASAFVRPGTNEVFNIRLVTQQQEGSDTAASLDKSRDNIINLTTCKTPTNLFMNYSIDGVAYSITGDGSQPFNPTLVAYPGSFTLVSTADKTKGIDMQFETAASDAGLYPTSHLTNLVVNGVRYQDDINTPSVVNFTRYDLLPGGYVAGSVDMYYVDKAGALHHLVANFRLKRIL